MKKTIAVFLFGIAGIFLVGCNTVHGVGKDIEKVGEKIQGGSKK